MESNWSVSHPSQVFIPGDQSIRLMDIHGARQDILSTSMITRRIQATHLYQLIQCYLSPREYLRFMNTNQRDFMGIKQETICYRIIGRDSQIGGTALKELKILVNRVKNPKKQIKLYLRNILLNDIGSIHSITPNIYCLEISTGNLIFSHNFDFSIFNNISVVSLSGFRGVSAVSNGLKNVRELTLSMDSLISMQDFPPSESLRKLTFGKCYTIPYLPKQMEEDGLALLYMKDYSPLPRLLTSTRCMVFENIGNTSLDLSRLFSGCYLCVLKLAYTLDTIPFTAEQIDLFINIDDLTISNGFGLSPLPLSKFYGRKLDLSSFELPSAWNRGSIFPNLKIWRLTNCRIPAKFPNLPNLTQLQLNYVAGPDIIPTFPSLNILQVGSNASPLLEIQAQPNLQEFELCGCHEIKHLDAFQGQIFRKIVISDCTSLQNIDYCGNSYVLELQNLPLIRRLPTPSLIKLKHRTLHLLSMDKIDLTQETLDAATILFDYLQQKDLNLLQFSNVRCMMIYQCPSLTTTSNFGNIQRQLFVHGCKNLIRLENLQHIPKVVLGSLPAVLDFRGLGHHELLCVHRVLVLENAARSYANDKAKGIAHLHEFHDIFRTISCFCIMKYSLAFEDFSHMKDSFHDERISRDREFLW